MKKIALVIMLLTIIAKVLGFSRDIILSYFYGASYISDAYLISITVPLSIFSFVGTGIATTYIPMYGSITNKENVYNANIFTNNLTNIILIICMIITALVLVFTTPLVKLFASGFQGETLKLAVLFTRINIFGIFFSGLLYIFNGYLQIKNNFVVPALVSIPLNLVIILAIMISYNSNPIVLAIGTVTAMAFQVLLLIPFIKKTGYKPRLSINIKDTNLIKMFYLALPATLGTSVNQINKIIDRTLASEITVGGISALNYANKLNLFIQGIFVLSLTAVMYPMITKMVANHNIAGLKKTLREVLIGVVIILIPTTIGAMIFSEQIVTMLYGRGAFDSQAIIITSSAMFFYSFGMIGFGLFEVLSRIFYSMQDTKTPMILAAIGLILNIVLNIILSRYLGIGGLALATSIAAIFTTGLMFISLHKKIGSFGMKQISISFLKILFASSFMGLLTKLSFDYLTVMLSQNLSLLITIAIGAVSYFAIIYFMKIEDVDVIVGTIKKKLG